MIVNNFYLGYEAAWRRIVVVVGCHLLADYVSFTKSSASKGRTMETMPTKHDSDTYKARVKYYHGCCQIGAILSCISANGIGSVWAPLFAIQISSFLMTLSHKKFNYGSETTIWEDYYNFALAIPYVYNFSVMPLTHILGTIAAIVLYMEINKFMNPRIPGKPTGFKFNYTKYALMVGLFLATPHDQIAQLSQTFYK